MNTINNLSNRLLILLVFLPLFLTAQYEFTWGEGLIKKMYYPFQSAALFQEELLVAYKDYNRLFTPAGNIQHVLFEKRSSEFRPVSSERREIILDEKKIAVVEFISLNDNLFILGETNVMKLPYNFVICDMDIKSLESKFLIREFPTQEHELDYFIVDGKGEYAGMEYLLVVSKVLTSDKTGFDITVNLFSGNMDLVFEKKIELNVDTKFIEVIKADLDAEGNILLACLEKPRPKKASIYNPRSKNFKGHIWSIGVIKEDMKYLEVTLGDENVKKAEGKFLRDIDFLDMGDELFVFGLYSETIFDRKEWGQLAEGVMLLKVEKREMFMPGKVFYSFDRELLHYNKNRNDKYRLDKKGGTEGVLGLNIQEVVADDRGGIILITEAIYTAYSSSDRSPTSNDYFNSNDILLMRFYSDGEYIWQNHIPKFNMYFNKEYSHLHYFKYLDKKHLSIFCNGPENLLDDGAKGKNPYSEKWENREYKSLFHFSFRLSDGELSIEEVETGLPDKFYVCTTPVKQISEGKFFLFGRNNTILRPGIFEFTSD